MECFRRNAEGLWVLHSYTQGSEIHLASVDFRASMDAIYEDVIFTNESQSAIERDCWRMSEGFHPSDIAVLNRQNDCVITQHIK
ncbi:MAG: hypothetical protein ACM65L_20305 [Microcoleus sp.]